MRFTGRGERQAALTKMQELIKIVDGWEGKDTVNSCNKFIMGEYLMRCVMSLEFDCFSPIQGSHRSLKPLKGRDQN